MSKYQDWLVKYINEHPDFIRPERYRNEVLAFLKEPLEDLCISRPKTRLTWGIELPFDRDYVTYVWFDALINYISALGYPEGESFRIFWPAAQHLIAKDILKPHGVYWPTMLKAMGIEPYQHLNVHGYWNVDQSKMSKSLGNVVRPLDLKDKYGLDAFRYFLLREMVFGLDANFHEEAFVSRLNSDLANDLGNLVSRSIAMARKYFAGTIPTPSGEESVDIELKAAALTTVTDLERWMESLTLHRALGTIWDFISRLNKYIVTVEPWQLAKTGHGELRLATVIYNILESLRFIAVLISPVMPQTAEKILHHLGVTDPSWVGLESLRQFGLLPPGGKVEAIGALFPRIDVREVSDESKEKPTGGQTMTPEITFEDFEKIDLRVGKILQAEAVPKSRKLIKLTVDIGEERVIVAGIAEHYQPEELVGKYIAVVANLKPAKLMGIESRGMLLATDTPDGKLTLIGFDRTPNPGARIR